jgi:hypothetical protein
MRLPEVMVSHMLGEPPLPLGRFLLGVTTSAATTSMQRACLSELQGRDVEVRQAALASPGRARAKAPQGKDL